MRFLPSFPPARVWSAVAAATLATSPLALRAGAELPPDPWDASMIWEAGPAGALSSVLFAPDGSAVQVFTKDGADHVVQLFDGAANELVPFLHAHFQ